MSAWGATPGKTFQSAGFVLMLPLYGPEYVAPVLVTPEPARVPAVCVPWLKQSSGFLSGCGTE